MKFDWDENKAQRKFEKHGVKFKHVIHVFSDADRVIQDDDKWDYGEDRFKLIGKYQSRLYAIIFTKRGEEYYRIISARKADKDEKREYWENSHIHL